MAKKRLGELLLERGLLSVGQLDEALMYQRQWGHRLGAALVAKGFLSEGMLTRVLSESLQIPMVDLAKVVVDPRAIELVRPSTAEEYDIFPIAIKAYAGRRTLLMAMADPLNVSAIDEVAFTTDMTVRPAIAQISSLRAAVRKYYFHEDEKIPRLNFEKRESQTPGELGLPDDEPMTITVGGGLAERTVDFTPPPPPASPVAAPIPFEPEITVDLEDEVPATPSRTVASRRHASFTVGDSVPVQDPFAERPVARTPGAPSYPNNAPTGAYTMAVPAARPGAFPPSVQTPPQQLSQPPFSSDPTEELEKKFWALMRVLAKKGVINRDEFMRELNNS